MADNKLTWTELRRALVVRAGVSEQEANTFLTAFVGQLVEGLKSDKSVKLNGFGTFKLQGVAPRKSVNVTTGEEITIEGYNKIVFTPEVGVKELVAKGAETETAGVDPIKRLGAQAEEIVDILGELGQGPKTEEKPKKAAKPAKKAAKKEKTKKAAPKATQKEAPKPTPKQEQQEEPVKQEKPKKAAKAKKAAKPAKPAKVEEPVPAQKPVQPEKPKKKYHFVRDTLICVIILLAFLLAGYLFMRNEISTWLELLTQPKPAQTEQVIVAEPVVEVVETVAAPAPEPEPYSVLLTTEAITKGSRLTWISKKHYGDKKYWPYLYDANRDRIKNPSKIAIGTPIRVPKLTEAQLDTTIESTRIHLEELRLEAEAACKK